jgi:hypothetical protein
LHKSPTENSRFSTDSSTLRADLLSVNAEAVALCEGLTPEQIGRRTDPGKWSIGENLLHLCITSEVFMPAVDRAIAETRRRGLRSAGPFRLNWYGRLLVRYVEPPPLIRLPAPKPLRPAAGGPLDDVLEKFLGKQAMVQQRIEDADGLDLQGFRFGSPLASYVRMNLLEFFSVGNGHSRRHLWQAAGVRHRL